MRRKPYAVILFDEVEKAHPDVFNLLLQILEDGRLTDGQGRVVDFKNTVIVMTSNAGAHTIKKQRSLGFGSSANSEKTYDDMQEQYHGRGQADLPAGVPEPSGRNHRVPCARPRARSSRSRGCWWRRSAARLSERGIELTLDDAAMKFISENGSDLQYGARPLRRAIQRMVEDALSEEILLGHIHLGDCVMGTVRDGALAFETVRPEPERELQPAGSEVN